MQKNFSENYPQIGHMPSKFSPALSQTKKKFEEYWC